MTTTTTTIRCTLSAAHSLGRETHDITVDLSSGEVTVPSAIRSRIDHEDQRISDAARRDVFSAATEALEVHHRETHDDPLGSDAPRARIVED